MRSLLFLCFLSGAVSASLQAGAMTSEVKKVTQSLQKEGKNKTKKVTQSLQKGAKALKEGASSLLPEAENKKYKNKWIIADLVLDGFTFIFGVVLCIKNDNKLEYFSNGLLIGSVIAFIIRLTLLALLKAKTPAQKEYKKKTLWHILVSVAMFILGILISNIDADTKCFGESKAKHLDGTIPTLIGVITRALIYNLIPIREPLLNNETKA